MNVVIITGATKGIGLACAQYFSSQGYRVFGTYRTERLENVCRELETEMFTLHRVDGSDYDAVNEFVSMVVKQESKIDILINNAGITRDGLVMRMQPVDFTHVMDVNLTSVFNYCKLVSRFMIKQKSGRIVNVSSVVGVVGNQGQANYAASKAGMIGFSKSLARELASRNITVNCVAPGFIETDMTRALSPQQIDVILQSIPMGRMGQTEDVRQLIWFLSSEGARYITGQVMHVDGGMVMTS